ncbi:Glycosyltransferase involved in cell wall bisynthesis [Paramicrobacterium humi]|uniref:Glycosyltransferase involved in cell wall bisynthesis n=1 Tax=Paramicrobacterium humi TaxID=640635 RepID=A0A1H4IRS6_9MICO|nr:glycosyltransferase [Microbacterium humi]SEB36794.1 Glycosyltransferase involved in cell wall bisynthesis [Microbacterium humi]
MRVLVVTTWYPSDGAPTTGTFVEHDVQLLALDHEVTVLHLAPPHEVPEPMSETRNGIRVRRFPMAPSHPTHVARASRVAARLLVDADVVHTMALSTLLPFALLRVRVPWVHTEHWSGILAPETVPFAMRKTLPFTLRLLARPDVVVAVSELLAGRIRRVRRKPTVVIPNHVAIAERRDTRPSRANEVKLVSVGRVTEAKGARLARDTVTELRRRGVAASLRWIGDGPLRDKLAESGEHEHVTFVGSLSHDAALDEFGDADVFILPTASETFGVAIAEALVAGLPVVVGGHGAQREFVSEPDGVLVTERTSAAYADGVQRVLELNASRSADEIGAHARARFSMASRRSAYAAAYARACGSAVIVPEGEDPAVDVIIPVHTPKRPIRRAAESVFNGTRANVRLTVVCHNTSVEQIANALGERAADPRVRLVEYRDGIPSPTGPFNHGLDLATGLYSSVMGSDDELEPGAIDSWLASAAESSADIIVPRVRYSSGGYVPTPPVRPFRRRNLRLVGDRLSYRSAPLGLVSRTMFSDLRFDATVETGEDVAYVTRLWTSGGTVAYDRSGPAYVIHDDAGDRTSVAARPLEKDLAFIPLLLGAPWFAALPRSMRRAAATKLFRINVIGAIYKRRDGAWDRDDRIALSRIVRELREAVPGSEEPLSRIDRRVLDAAADPDADDRVLNHGAEQRMRRLHPASVLTRRPSKLFHREAPMRMGFATVLQLIRLG